jgi:hypothetical protein
MFSGTGILNVFRSLQFQCIGQMTHTYNISVSRYYPQVSSRGDPVFHESVDVMSTVPDSLYYPKSCKTLLISPSLSGSGTTQGKLANMTSELLLSHDPATGVGRLATHKICGTMGVLVLALHLPELYRVYCFHRRTGFAWKPMIFQPLRLGSLLDISSEQNRWHWLSSSRTL